MSMPVDLNRDFDPAIKIIIKQLENLTQEVNLLKNEIARIKNPPEKKVK
jgi:prefoldin subunit 5